MADQANDFLEQQWQQFQSSPAPQVGDFRFTLSPSVWGDDKSNRYETDLVAMTMHTPETGRLRHIRRREQLDSLSAARLHGVTTVRHSAADLTSAWHLARASPGENGVHMHYPLAKAPPVAPQAPRLSAPCGGAAAGSFPVPAARGA